MFNKRNKMIVVFFFCFSYFIIIIIIYLEHRCVQGLMLKTTATSKNHFLIVARQDKLLFDSGV